MLPETRDTNTLGYPSPSELRNNEDSDSKGDLRHVAWGVGHFGKESTGLHQQLRLRTMRISRAFQGPSTGSSRPEDW